MSAMVIVIVLVVLLGGGGAYDGPRAGWGGSPTMEAGCSASSC
jgi:hypothetical protein